MKNYLTKIAILVGVLLVVEIVLLIIHSGGVLALDLIPNNFVAFWIVLFPIVILESIGIISQRFYERNSTEKYRGFAKQLAINMVALVTMITLPLLVSALTLMKLDAVVSILNIFSLPWMAGWLIGLVVYDLWKFTRWFNPPRDTSHDAF